VITLLLGGARSGKSALAERIAARDPAVTYVATGWASDSEMKARIEAHRSRRPLHWITVEMASPSDLPTALTAAEGTVLLDALGTWVAGHLDFQIDTTAFIDALVGRRGDTIVVSDEVGLGVHPSTEVGQHFRDALGTLNHAVADVADEVLLVVAGRVLPLPRWVDPPNALR
jgi:adenosylcobinamide kinase/adenosylcobinamide-phosphate guanylyltransferase